MQERWSDESVMKRILMTLAALLLLTVTGLSAQDKGYDVFVPIGKYIA